MTNNALGTSPNERMQIVTLLVHAGVVALVVIGTIALAIAHQLPSDAVVGLLGTALGFSGSAATYRVGYRGGFQAGDRSGDVR